MVNGRTIYNHIASTNVSDKFMGRKQQINQVDICDYLKEWRKKSRFINKKNDNIFGYKHTAGHWFKKDNHSGIIQKPNNWLKLKEILDFDEKYDKQVLEFEEKQIKFVQSLRITNCDRPSDTITASSHEIHINKKRRLSVRECAILQTFPDNFVFYESLKYKTLYFLSILYEGQQLNIIAVNLLCIPNGQLVNVYKTDTLKAGKFEHEARFNFFQNINF